MMKVVMKLDIADEKMKRKVMKKVSDVPGLESMALDPKDNKLTVIGNVDPVAVVERLRQLCRTEILSVGPAKEPEKKKEEPKKEEPKKVDPAEMLKIYQAYYQNQWTPAVAVVQPRYFSRSVEEDPNACVIS